jgi:hypothetical protein
MKERLTAILGSGWNSTTEWKVTTALDYLKDKDKQQALVNLQQLKQKFGRNINADAGHSYRSGMGQDFYEAELSEYQATCRVIEIIETELAG